MTKITNLYCILKKVHYYSKKKANFENLGKFHSKYVLKDYKILLDYY